MMIDYNIRDDWPDDEPRWLKSLVSSLSRRDEAVTILPLSISVQEIIDWVDLASGEEAWAKKLNRASLHADFVESVEALGPTLRAHLSKSLDAFATALRSLFAGGNAVLKQPAGLRTGALWSSVEETGRQLIIHLASDDAVRACWADLVSAAHRRDLRRREHRPIVDTLAEQQRLRNRDPVEVTKWLSSAIAYGPEKEGAPWAHMATSVDDRLALAEQFLLSPAERVRIAVWFSYSHLRLESNFEAGCVAFYLPYYAAAGTESDLDYRFKNELTKLNSHGWWDQISSGTSRVDAIVRVDLGTTFEAGSVGRAERVLDTLFDVVIHQGKGQRPERGQFVVLHDGEPRIWYGRSNNRPLTAEDDPYGVQITGSMFRAMAPKLGQAIAEGVVPTHLSAALEAQLAADEPRARGKISVSLDDSDVRAIIAREDQAVQHIAALASETPAKMFLELTSTWSKSKWYEDLVRAIRYCLVDVGPNRAQIEELRGTYYQASWEQMILLAVDHKSELLAYCQVESERAWVARLLSSASEMSEFGSLLSEYSCTAEVLTLRRARARNAVVHGNPLAAPVARTVLDLSEYLGHRALQIGLAAYIDGKSVQQAISDDELAWRGALAEPSIAEYCRAYEKPDQKKGPNLHH